MITFPAIRRAFFAASCRLALFFICSQGTAGGLGFGISNPISLDTRNKEGYSNIIRLDTRGDGSYETLSNSLPLDTRTTIPAENVAPDSLSGLRITFASTHLSQAILCSDTIAHLEYADAEPQKIQYTFTRDADNHAWFVVPGEGLPALEAELTFLDADHGTAVWWLEGLPDTGYFSLKGPIPDRDLDGMDDAWEQTLVDLNPEDDLDSIDNLLPEDDFDGDSETNADEFANGTDAADATDTANPANAFSDFALTATRHVEQTAPGFSERGFSLQLTVLVPQGSSFTRGFLTPAGGAASIALTVAADGTAAAYHSPILATAAYVEYFPSGTYTIHCEWTDGQNLSWLLFAAEFSSDTDADTFPNPLEVVSHPPFADRLPNTPPPTFDLSSSQWRKAILRNDYADEILAILPNPDFETRLAIPGDTLQGLPLYTLDISIGADDGTQTETRFWFATDLSIFQSGWVFAPPPGSQFGQQTLETCLFGSDRHEPVAWETHGSSLRGIDAQTPLSSDRPVWIGVLTPLLHINQSASVPDPTQLTLAAGWNAVCLPAGVNDDFLNALPDHDAIEAVWEWDEGHQRMASPKPATGIRRALWIFATSATNIPF